MLNLYLPQCHEDTFVSKHAAPFLFLLSAIYIHNLIIVCAVLNIVCFRSRYGHLTKFCFIVTFQVSLFI